MRIGILSDTHGKLPSKIFAIFNDVDMIVHAGDICGEEIITDLNVIAPVKAVFGNMDRSPLSYRLPRVDFFKIEQFTICITHIVNSKKAFAYELLKMGKKADMVIFGHTHIPEDFVFNGIRFINPGSAVQPRGGTSASVAILEVNSDGANVKFVEVPQEF